MATKAFLEKAYLAYFGRPVDSTGLTDFASSTDTQVADAFAASAESKALYGTTFDFAQINAIYLALFNREAEKAGLEYWYAKVADKTFTAAGAAIAILNGAQNADKTAIDNKLVASAAFTAALDTAPEMIGYSGSAAAASARAFLSGVTTSAATAAAVDAAVASAVAARNNVAGQTFTLTTGVDTFTGTSANDSFSAFFGTAGDSLGAGDTIDGGAGTDTLTLTTTGAAASSVATTVRNVETIQIRGLVSSTFDATSVTGATAINVIDTIAGTTATVQGLKALSTVIGATGPGGVTVTHGNASVGGLADTALISVTGAGAAGTNAVGAASNAVSAAITASTTGIEGYSIATSGVNIITFTGSTTALTDGATLTVTGNGNNTITASALTQASLYDLSTSTGTNTLNVAGALTTSDTVKGGTGADTLRTNNATTVANLTVTGVETARLSTGSSTGNMVFATAPNYTTIRVDGDTAESGTQTLTGVGNTVATINYVGDSLTANNATAQQFNNLTINNSLTGTETIAVNIGNGTISNSGGYTLRTLTANGLENINITANDLGASATATFTGITSTALTSINVTATSGGVDLGTVDGVTAAGTSGNLAILDFSKVVGTTLSNATLATNTVGAGTVILGATGTGGTTITLGAETGTDTVTYTGGQGVDTVTGAAAPFAGTMVVSGLGGADVLTGGSGADTLDGGTGGDTLVGSAGNDTLIAGEGADTLTGGTGNDVINLTEVTSALDIVVFGGAAITSAGGNADTITGFTSADRMQFGSTFLLANTYVSGTLATIAASTVQGMSANSGLIILVSDTLAGASGSSAINGLLAGTSGFSVAGSQTAMIVAADGSNAYVWFVNDGFDTNAVVSAADVHLIGTLSGVTSLAAYGAANFGATIAA